MKIAIVYKDGAVADAGTSSEYLIITTEDGQPTSKELIRASGSGPTAALTFLGLVQADALICGALSVAMRGALELLGLILVPGVTGSAEEAAAKFIVGEPQGDPCILEVCREEDPDDPLSCMHDCARCAGCGPVQVPPDAALPEIN